MFCMCGIRRRARSFPTKKWSNYCAVHVLHSSYDYCFLFLSLLHMAGFLRGHAESWLLQQGKLKEDGASVPHRNKKEMVKLMCCLLWTTVWYILCVRSAYVVDSEQQIELQRIC